MSVQKPFRRIPAAPALLTALVTALALALATTPYARASERPESGPRSLDEAIALAESAHPGLRAARLERDAALARAEAADALPDPRITLGVFAEEVQTRVGPQEATLSVSQTLPWFGKRSLRREAALGDAQARTETLESARLKLRERVVRAWVELWLFERRRVLEAENVAILRRFEEVVRTRYKVAAARHPDLLRVQLEIGRAEDRLRRLEDLRAPAAARLNELLGRPVDAPLATPAAIPDETLAPEAEVRVLDQASEQPAVRALDAMSETAGLRAELARKERYPDVTFGVTWTSIGAASLPSVPGSGQDAWLATVSVNVPLWSSDREADVRRALAKGRALAATAEERALSLQADARHALFEHRDAARRVALYQDSLVPKVHESLRASVIAYSTGEGDFLALLDTERTLLEMRLAEERARADVATSLARLDAIAGTTLPRAGPSPLTPRDTQEETEEDRS